MKPPSLRTRILLLTATAIAAPALLGFGVLVQERVTAAHHRFRENAHSVALALQPMLANTLVVGDLATVQETIEPIAAQPSVARVVLLHPGDRRIVLQAADGSQARQSTAPEWFRRLFAAPPVVEELTIATGGVDYGILRVEMSDAGLFDDLWTTARQFFVAGTASLLGVIFLLGIALRRGLAPLRLLSEGARRLAAGNWQERIPAIRVPEIAEVARVFNAMADELEIAIQKRQRAEEALLDANDALEEKVRGRTADLQAINSALVAEQARKEELIRKLELAHNQLLQSEKMASIGQLAAGVAHEINNPVGFVNANLGTLTDYAKSMLALLAAYERAEAALPAEARGELARLKGELDIAYLREDLGNLLAESREGLERVKRIVADLREFSHVDGSEWQWADLEKGLESTLNVVWNELKYKAEVVREYGRVPEIECIPSQINQVFMNLLVNAAQAIEGKGRIVLRTGADDAQVWVDVEDTGKGIAPEHLKRIFEPFFTTKPVGKGTGLGLSLSYGIVEKHGGRIEVESEAGKGARFRVWLPRRSTRPAVTA